MFRLCVLILFLIVYTETMSHNIKVLVHSYEKKLNHSLKLTKSDKDTVDSWIIESDLERVNITTKYRVEMNKHREHEFAGADENWKWKECVKLYRREIKKFEDTYYEQERECLKTTATEQQEKMNAVEQVEREIRKWRKGYRYLVRTCDVDNPNDKDGANICLVQYMQRDNYNNVIERLLMLKQEAMENLSVQLTTTVLGLEECLKAQLSEYLEGVRTIMEILNECYNV